MILPVIGATRETRFESPIHLADSGNCESRLVQVEHPDSGTVEYAYNGDGLLVEQTVDGSETTRYVYDGNNRLQETDDIGVTEVDFTYTPGGYGEVRRTERMTIRATFIPPPMRSVAPRSSIMTCSSVSPPLPKPTRTAEGRSRVRSHGSTTTRTATCLRLAIRSATSRHESTTRSIVSHR